MRKTLIFAAATVAALGLGRAARADVAYGYAQQTITGLTVTGTGLANGVFTGSASSNSAVINGAGIATNNPTDALQAYVGAVPPAPQNSYVKYSTQGGGPQAGVFTRGDSVITNLNGLFGSGVNASNVAESILSTAGAGSGLATGSGNWSVAGTFTSAGTSVTVGYNWANDILDSVIGTSSSAQSSFKLTITIKDQHGHEVDATPVELNTALSSPPNGPEIITSGSGSAVLSLAGLTAGDVLGISISGTELSSASIAAVPEPSSLALCVLGAVGLAGYARRRRSSRS